MLHAMTVRGLHPAFRIQRSSAAAFNSFRDGDRDDARIRITPGKEALRKLRAAGFATPVPPVVLRLVRYDIADERYVLATTLDDPDRYSVADLSDLHHGRWSIEEPCNLSSQCSFQCRGWPLRPMLSHVVALKRVLETFPDPLRMAAAALPRASAGSVRLLCRKPVFARGRETEWAVRVP